MPQNAYVERYEVDKALPNSRELCRDHNLDRKVIVAWLWTTANEKQVRAALSKLLSVQSPYVVDVYDLLHHNGQLGLVHEFCDGQPLQASLQGASSEILLKALFQLSSAISDVNAAGLSLGPLNASLFCESDSGVLKLAHVTKAILQGPAHGDDRSWLGQFATPFLAGRTDLPAGLQAALHNLATNTTSNTIEAFARKLESYLVKDQHRALLTHQGKVLELGASLRHVSLSHPSGFAQVEVSYDGLAFRIKSTAGEVYVNNIAAVAGTAIPEACIIALGGPQRPANQRQFVTMDLSHPGVVL